METDTTSVIAEVTATNPQPIVPVSATVDAKIILSDEHKKKIVDLWNSNPTKPPSLRELVEVNFPGKDGRSNEGMAVKAYLSVAKIKAQTSYEADHKVKPADPVVTLKPEQEEFIKNNLNQSAIDITKIVFNNITLGLDSPEYKAVAIHLRGIPEYKNRLALDDYKSPRNTPEAMARINRYVPVPVDKDKLTPQQKICIESTLNILSGIRFRYIINSYMIEEQRELFEYSFVNYIYDKADLIAEDIELYLNLAMENVDQADLIRRRNLLSDYFDTAVAASGGTSASKSIGDMIDSISNAIDHSKERQEKIIKSLRGTRSERMKHKLQENQSISALIEGFKQEEHRQRMAKFAMNKDEKVRDVIRKYETMDKLMASIWGISPEEIVPPEEEKTEEKTE